MKYLVKDIAADTGRYFDTAAEAAEAVQIDTDEMLWAIAEEGICETDTHTVEEVPDGDRGREAQEDNPDEPDWKHYLGTQEGDEDTGLSTYGKELVDEVLAHEAEATLFEKTQAMLIEADLPEDVRGMLQAALETHANLLDLDPQRREAVMGWMADEGVGRTREIVSDYAKRLPKPLV